MADPQKNKETVLAYYNLAFNDEKPAEAAEKYGGPHYIQHNPQAADGFEAFVEFVEGFAEQFPQMSLDIRRAVAEGDLVVTHSLLKTSPEDRGTAAADLFRLEDGKVVEHWDVVQPVPESAANDHPMFLRTPGLWGWGEAPCAPAERWLHSPERAEESCANFALTEYSEDEMRRPTLNAVP